MIELLDDERRELKGNWKLISFNYQKLVISYGDIARQAESEILFSSIVVITWSYSEGAQLKFGEIRGISASNPHSIALLQFQTALNETKSLANIILQLTGSFQLCRALGRLPIHCSVGTVEEPKLGTQQRPPVARQNFSVICESPCHYRLIFRNYYCIDFVVQRIVVH